MNIIKNDIYSYDEVHSKEKKVLESMRKFDAGNNGLDDTLNDLMEYTKINLIDPKYPDKNNSIKLENLYKEYKLTLENTPWKKCSCNICKQCGIEMAIFREVIVIKKRYT